MIDYIKENCQLPPLEAPLYDEDADAYGLWFDERECSWYPYPDPQLICIPCETREEANKLHKESIELYHEEVREQEERKLASKNS